MMKKFSFSHLNNPLLIAEIGNNQAKDVIQIFKNKKIKCLELAKDIQHLNRLLVLQKNKYKINVD